MLRITFQDHMNVTWNPLGGRHSHVIGLRIPAQRSRLANQKVRT